MHALITQDVVLTSFQRHLTVMDVRWTLKQRCVLTGCLSMIIKYRDTETSISHYQTNTKKLYPLALFYQVIIDM